ncbi:MAG: 50S ribosomal protein L6, partial [Alphaproteobacteria bacterium]
MSRIGKNPVPIPDGVTVEVSGRQVSAKGKLGELHVTLMEEVEVERDGDQILVRPRDDSDRAKQMWGTARSVVNNLVTGVAEGFTRDLEINGVGYRAQVQGQDLILQLGFSHEVRYPIPEGITVQCPAQTQIVIKGADKQRVGQTAAEIRAFRPPEPY